MSQILTMLNAKSISIDGIPGRASVTPEMVAAACKNIPTIVELYARVKIAGQYNYLDKLQRCHLLQVRDVAEKGGWRPGIAVDKFAAMALEDAILPNLCQRCNGAGAHNNRKTCARCEGTGIGKTRSARSRAAQIGVSPATWRNTWQSRLAESARIFAEYDDLINREIRRQLSGQ